jgi:murein DD-endopeptidase MepM/ murein hydrolase activator NlpD
MYRALSTLTFAALAAAACASDTGTPVTARTPHDIVLRADFQIVEALVPPHATLDALLREHDLPADLVQKAISSARDVFNPRQLRAEQPYKLVRTVDGLLREFEYEIDNDRFLRIASSADDPDELEAEVLPIEKETDVVAVEGTIDPAHTSLIAAVTAAGEETALALAVADIFSGHLDFHSDIQQGDSFEVLFEKQTREGAFAGYGNVLGARFVNGNDEYVAFRWVNPETGKAGYYDAGGQSMKRFMLATPLKFEPRITSGFTTRRLHPVLGGYRAHLGIDYGAPTGAPVVAVADGTVVSAAWAGGGGRQVRLRHSGGYETYYLHLSAFARGMRAGARVAQGQTIGFVGSSGTATGPHLDYRLKRNGVFVNPLRERSRLPAGDPIPRARLVDFEVARDRLLERMDTTRLASSSPAVADTAVNAVR